MISAQHDDSLCDVIARLKDAGISQMPVMREGKLDGIVAEVDLLHALVSGEGDAISLRAGADGAGVLLLRGAPLREPVAHYGPFVMNTPGEIEQALRDYRDGVFA